MIKNGIYSGTTRKSKPVARILATVFGVLAFLLICFIVWSALTFKDGTKDVFVPQAKEISELKIEVETQNKTIDELRAQIVDLEEELAEEKKKTAELVKPEEPTPEDGELPLEEGETPPVETEETEPEETTEESTEE